MSGVTARIEGRAGCITLNRPQALNALTLEMVHAIDAALLAWAGDPAVCLVVLDGAGGRALCAGGDIRALYDAAKSGELSFAEVFFRDEYRLNAYIVRYPKPYVALMDGIVMGGGIGLSAHGRHRVVTERARLAMPETGIGFFPDVGGTWLLGRAPGQFGVYAALTAGQMGATDAIECGLADVFVPSKSLPLLRASLTGCASTEEVRACLDRHAQTPLAGRYAKAAAWIGACFAADTMEEIVSALSAHADPAARQAAAEITPRSPTSLKITLRALREAARLGCLEPCLEREFGLALACMQHPDFLEGVRAAIVDKDRSPRWKPARLDDVTADMVGAAFIPPPGETLGLENWLASRGISVWQ